MAQTPASVPAPAAVVIPSPPPELPAPTPVEPWRAADADVTATPVNPALQGSGATSMVVSESALASHVGHDILAAGGNAVDAAVATAFAMAVAHPAAGNIGGGGFAVVRAKDGKLYALDFRETAPGKASPDMFLDEHGVPTRESLVGPRAAGVPGAVAGLWELHKKLGKLPWQKLLAPAIAMAKDGFALPPFAHEQIAMAQKSIEHDAASSALWLDGGKPKAAGTLIKIPELATTLTRISKQGSNGFYRGPTAKLIAASMIAGHGLISEADLAAYHAIWRAPLLFTYRGYHLATMPLPSSGGIVLAMTASMISTVAPTMPAWHSLEHVHLLVEAWRRAYAARNELLGDPAFVNVPIQSLLDPGKLAALAATIDPAHATPSDKTPILTEGDHTTNLCVVDGDGEAVALTTTLNTWFGSGVTVPGAGFVLNNEMDDFTAKPGSPNAFGLVQGVANKIEPGKRMLSSMSPTIIEDDHHQLVMVVGGQGGSRIITAVFQVLSNVLDYHLPVSIAVAAPRVHHQHLPDVVQAEPNSITQAVGEELRRRGDKIEWTVPPRHLATITAIVHSNVPGVRWNGAADPRQDGTAVGD